MPTQHETVAIVYDFDGTLAPSNVQENQFIPDVGMTQQEFWAEVGRVHRVARAVYSADSDMDKIIKARINFLSAQVEQRKIIKAGQS